MRVVSKPYSIAKGWTRHFLMKNAGVLAYVDTHPASGIDAVKLSNLYVYPRHRGHGYGKLLIKQALRSRPDKDFVITPNPWQDKAVPKEKLASMYADIGFEKMAGERYKDLMVFRRTPAFKLGAVVGLSSAMHSTAVE